MKKFLSIASIILVTFTTLYKINRARQIGKINDETKTLEYKPMPGYGDTVFAGIYNFPLRIKIVSHYKKDGLYDSIAAKMITKNMYDEISCFGGEDLLRYREGKRYGFLDTLGNEVIPAMYEFATAFSEEVTCVQLNDKWGFINKKNEIILPFKYQSAVDFSDGKAAVKLNNKWGMINHSGNYILENKYDDIVCTFPGTDTLAEVRLDSRFFFIDKKGKILGYAEAGY